jgi:diketogulonate reductase-like aldo/keto reductase
VGLVSVLVITRLQSQQIVTRKSAPRAGVPPHAWKTPAPSALDEGRSESSLGQALRGLPRDRVVIGTKVSPAHVQPATLLRCCEASLRRLATDYIDLYMMHWPITLRSIRHFDAEASVCPAVDDAFATLLRLRDQGKVRHIGVSNHSLARLDEALRHCPTLVADDERL